MDAAASLGILGTLALAVVLSASAGLRAWLPLLAVGVMARIGFTQLGDSFDWLQSTPAIALFGVATALEMAGDKIPVVDHALDAVGTVVRPLAGALAAAAVLYRIEDPLLSSIVGLLVGAPTALVPHAMKSAARGASTVTTAGIANPLLSFLEDLIAIALTWLAFLLPFLGLLLLALCMWFATRWIARRRVRRQVHDT